VDAWLDSSDIKVERDGSGSYMTCSPPRGFSD
jgi:hypothetical protein